MSTKKATRMIFPDMLKAFERVPDEPLLLKIKFYDLADPLYSWLASYISGRCQVVSINGTSSEPQSIASDVLLGSFIGSLVLLLQVNDIFQAICQGKQFLLADDIKEIYSFELSPLPQTMDNIKEDLTSLDEWRRHWMLHFCATKTVLLAYKFRVPSGRFFISGLPLLPTQCVEDLGL